MKLLKLSPIYFDQDKKLFRIDTTWEHSPGEIRSCSLMSSTQNGLLEAEKNYKIWLERAKNAAPPK